jgi:hypothetical protein
MRCGATGTIAAAYYARNQWLTAQQQLSAMRDTEMRQLRAYLHAGHGPIEVSNTSASAEVRIFHSGQTPARQLKLDAVIEVAHFPLLPTEKLISPVDMSGIPKYEFAALYGPEPIKQKISTPANSSEAIQIQRESDPMKGGRQRFYLHGRVRYFDIFDHEWPYDFCFSFDPASDLDGGENGCEDYNRPR